MASVVVAGQAYVVTLTGRFDGSGVSVRGYRKVRDRGGHTSHAHAHAQTLASRLG